MATSRDQMQRSAPYRQAVPAIGLSLERSTGRVPDDGCYYVLLRGELKGRHRTLKPAKIQYKDLLAASGWEPARTTGGSAPVNEAVERYMDQLETYWGASHTHSRRGGKTMYRS